MRIDTESGRGPHLPPAARPAGPTAVLELVGLICGPPHRPAEYGVCPRYTVKQGDILFDIAKKIGVEQGEQGSVAATACDCGTMRLSAMPSASLI